MSGSTLRRSVKAVPLAFVAAALALGSVPAAAAVMLSTDPSGLAAAAVSDGALIAGAEIETRPPTARSLGIGNNPVAGFPRSGTTFLVMSTGDASVADQAGASSSQTNWNLGGSAVRGNSDRDVSILRIDLNVPAGANCLRLDFRFLTTEWPAYVGSLYSDGFIAELNSSTWTTAGHVVAAPDNFILDEAGGRITINSTGVTAMTAADAEGTPYTGATPLLRATTPIPAGDGNGTLPGNNSLYLSVFDHLDAIFDSTVFVDNISVDTVPDPATQCARRARIPTGMQAEPVVLDGDGSTPTLNSPDLKATLVDSVSGTPLAGKTIQFYPNGAAAAACEAQTNAGGEAVCSDPLAQVAVILAGGYRAVFAGDVTHAPALAPAPLLTLGDTPLP